MITAQSHLPSALALPDVEVAALVDPVEERAAGLARSFGIRPKIASELGSVLDDLDGAIIATPNATHRDLAVRCLEGGVNVLVEKPLAVTAAEGEEIAAAATRHGKVAAVGYVTRYYSNVTFLESLLRSRHFGRVHRFHHQFGTSGGWAPMSGYTLDRSLAGGGVLVVTGTHFLDRMLALWGAPDKIEYQDDSLGGPEANCQARLWFNTPDGGLEGTIRYSKTTKLPGGLVLDTDAGCVLLEDSMSAQVILRPKTTPAVELTVRPRVQPRRAGNAFIWQIDDFVRASRSGGRPRVSAVEGTDSLRLIERLYTCRSLTNDHWYLTQEAA
jgi:predicted dehydrogenase